MAMVRELITLVKFQTTGMNQVNAQVNSLKSSIMAVGKLFGIYFAADKVFELVDGLVSAGKEINKLSYQLNRMARPGDDIAAAQERIFKIAQATGIAYTDALGTYKEFLNESKELNVSQETLLNTTENLYKGLRLSAASPEEISNVMSTLDRAFRMGRIGLRQFGLLADNARDVVDALERSSGKTRTQLEEMAKEGTLSAEFFFKHLGKLDAVLSKDFENRPIKLGEAFTYAWNRAAKLSAQIWKMANVTGTVAKAIVYFTDLVFDGFDKVVEKVGGLNKLLELLGITAGVVIGAKMIPLIYTLLTAMSKASAATALLAAKWVLVGLAIAGAILFIQDIMVWMRGGRSLMGKWLGPFDEFKDKMSKMFEDSPLLAPLRMIRDLFSGDFGGAFENLKASFADIDTTLVLLGVTITGIAAAFKLWNLIPFTGLINSLIKVIAQSVATKAAVEAVSNPDVDLDAEGKPTKKPAGKPKTKTPDKGGGKAWLLGFMARFAPLLLAGPAGGEDKPFSDERNAEWLRNNPPAPNAIPGEGPGGGTGSWTGLLGRLLERVWLGPEYLRNQIPAPLPEPPPPVVFGQPTPQVTPSVTPLRQVTPIWNPNNAIGTSVLPNVTPGQVTPGQPAAGPGVINNTPTVNQRNTVTIQIDPSLQINNQIRQGIADALGELARQAANSMPAVEARTQ